jgi:predicted dehydrogenase
VRPGPGSLPRSIAIAGAWGYIGRKFLDVALARGLTTFVHDPGPMPQDLDPGRFTRIEEEAEFDRLEADVFHLAVHPEHRRLAPLLGREQPPLILVEKPMAEPERPEVCREVLDAVGRSRAVVLYDFPELYDPITAQVLDHLASYREVSLTEVHVQRSKDREDRGNPRNVKRMVPIQYQETVHCLAFVLQVLGAIRGGVREALAGGIHVEGDSAPYDPPNPEAYPYVVDGRCRFHMTIGEVRVEGLTDFKSGAPWAKRRVIRGFGDGRPFEVEASYLEGEKSLRIDGEDQAVDPSASSYEGVLATLARWAVEFDRPRLMGGLFPNPGFARLSYQLSSALWRSCRDRSALAFRDAAELESFDAGFAAEVARLPRYATAESHPSV